MLSLIPKKNHYYIFICWPFIVLFLAHGLHGLNRYIRLGLGVYYMCMVGSRYLAKSMPEHQLAAWLGRRTWIYPMRTEHFQTYDGSLDIRPQRTLWAQRTLKALDIPKDSCFDIVLTGSHAPEELQVRHGVGCTRFQGTIKTQKGTGIILVEQSPKYRQYWGSVRQLAGETAELAIENKTYWYFRRKSNWFEQRAKRVQ